MPKPRDPNKPTQHDILHMRIDQTWLAEVSRAATAMGVSTSEYIRGAVSEQLRRDGYSPPETAMKVE